MKNKRIIRWTLFIAGITILTFGARIILLSQLGVGGLDAIAIGLAEWTGMSIGTLIILLGISLIIIGGSINKRLNLLPIGVSLLIGCFYDAWGVLLFNHIPSPTHKPYTGYVFLIGILIAPIGAALYILSRISVGPVDYVMLAIRNRYSSSIQSSRILLESLFVLIGWLIGGPIGVGTICIMLFWGPILQVYLKVLKHVLKKYTE